MDYFEWVEGLTRTASRTYPEVFHFHGRTATFNADPKNEMGYNAGTVPPHFPVPALVTKVTFHSRWEKSPFHSSVIIEDGEGGMYAIWDFNFDRCMDFHYKYGVYVCGREIDEGVKKYREERYRED